VRRGTLSRQGLGCPTAEQPLHDSPFGAHLVERELVRPLPRHDDEIDPARQEIRPQAKALPAKSPDSISKDGIPCLARHHETYARQPRRRRVRCDEQRKMRRSNTPTVFLLLDEFVMTS
jgi:hypothetical protein